MCTIKIKVECALPMPVATIYKHLCPAGPTVRLIFSRLISYPYAVFKKEMLVQM